MKLLAFNIIALGLGLVFTGLTNMQQTEEIKYLSKRIECLERGMVYVGDGWCSPQTN